jgi:hypothetical protein
MFGEHVCVVYQHFLDGELLLTRTKVLNGKFEVITAPPTKGHLSYQA